MAGGKALFIADIGNNYFAGSQQLCGLCNGNVLKINVALSSEQNDGYKWIPPYDTKGQWQTVVIPLTENGYIGKVKAKAQNSGKLQIGQKVNIRIANYPDREYGIIEGKLKTISSTPDKEGNLLLDIELPNGLQTSYNKQINFQQEMTGTADIITDDLRLLQRLLYQFRDVFRR